MAENSIAKLSAGLPKEVIITSSDKKLAPALKKLKGFNAKTADRIIGGTYAGDVNILLAVLAEHKVENLHMHDADLESVFMHFYGDGNA